MQTNADNATTPAPMAMEIIACFPSLMFFLARGQVTLSGAPHSEGLSENEDALKLLLRDEGICPSKRLSERFNCFKPLIVASASKLVG